MGFLKERHYRVHYYEIDYKKRILPAALINYLQDVATAQSEELGVGIDFLAENHLAWPLIQWDIRIAKYPVFDEEIKVSTRPMAFDKFYAYREFFVEGPDGTGLAEAYSLWILKDTAKNRIAKIPFFMFEKYGVAAEDVPQREMSKPRELSRVDVEKEFGVRYSDIDTNRHVNNVKYLEWAMETMPIETVVKCVLHRIRINYKRSTLFGEKVRVCTEIIHGTKGEITGLHQIENEQGQTVCLLETAWIKEESTP
ncbi:acyl-[acyl-carrier-protein] thioesterase [Candidatus Formimonas warabiya]|uniref:Acyl-ACP thioesterase n=1 Tax=Formimonas warabiya TaxID=1761012 RepID=A0A3G1KRU0_FORW1|nr:acyl-ACP thioesterase domain-containing protein [Candidatus Formimonas warabiya]ATW25202.1 hypothetical protein DCMF_10870 [Candidatus Formimonas warabiya]